MNIIQHVSFENPGRIMDWIQYERHWIKKVVDSGKAMLGICLGAQQLAKAYGSDLISTPKEVGWHLVTSLTQILHPSKEYTVLHWLGEGFTKSCHAKLLYSTEKYLSVVI